jgi:hypothetical protein
MGGQVTLRLPLDSRLSSVFQLVGPQDALVVVVPDVVEDLPTSGPIRSSFDRGNTIELQKTDWDNNPYPFLARSRSAWQGFASSFALHVLDEHSFTTRSGRTHFYYTLIKSKD